MNNDRTKRYAAGWCAALACAVVAVPACAQTAPTPADPAVTGSEIGHAASGWRELQRSNASAAPAQPMVGEEAGLAYRRYMESFKSKIPALYGSSVNQGSGNGGGNAGGLAPTN